MADEKKVKYDVEGYDIITSAIRELVNQYPGLQDGEEIAFSVLGEDSGKALFTLNGAVIESEKEDITGHVTQICSYPFTIVYRAARLSENRKADVKEWLDNLARWLKRQKVTLGDTEYCLSSYPTLTNGRKFTEFDQQTPGHLDSINENASENWIVQITAKYRNEFDKW